MRRLIFDLWPVLLLLLLWQIGVSAAGYSSIVLVPPGAVLSDPLHLPGAYLSPALHTLAFALAGLGAGMALGLLLALAAWLSDLLAVPAALPALVAEYLMQAGGLGTLFAVTMQQFQLARALGASALAMVLSVALFEATRAIEARVSGIYGARS